MRVIDCSRDSHLPCAKRYAPGGEELPACVAVEHAMDVYINERLAMRLTCTPEHLDELVAGRLVTEGLARGPEEIQEIYICEKGLRARVLLSSGAADRLAEKDAETVATCCTDNRTLLSGPEEAAAVTPIAWDASWLLGAMEQLRAEQRLYDQTHAVHACALIREGRLLCCREDIGRHNALDKAVGWALLTGADLAGSMLFTTGRLPGDMVMKAIRVGVPLLASKTYPTDRGAALARQAGLTLITVRPGGQTLVWPGREKMEERIL